MRWESRRANGLAIGVTRRLLGGKPEEVGEEGGSPPYFRAMVWARLERTDEAMAELRRAYRERANS